MTIHGRHEEAERTVHEVEQEVEREEGPWGGSRRSRLEIRQQRVGLYIVPLALGNLLGTLLLGRLFDTVGRRIMITLSYIGSGLTLVVAVLFQSGALDARTLTIAWCVVFFFASAGASAAYLTLSEISPMETRAMAIAVSFAVGTVWAARSGRCCSAGWWRPSGWERSPPATTSAPGLMIAAGLVEWWLGVDAENTRLEHLAAPLSAGDGSAPAAR